MRYKVCNNTALKWLRRILMLTTSGCLLLVMTHVRAQSVVQTFVQIDDGTASSTTPTDTIIIPVRSFSFSPAPTNTTVVQTEPPPEVIKEPEKKVEKYVVIEGKYIPFGEVEMIFDVLHTIKTTANREGYFNVTYPTRNAIVNILVRGVNENGFQGLMWTETVDLRAVDKVILHPIIYPLVTEQKKELPIFEQPVIPLPDIEIDRDVENDDVVEKDTQKKSVQKEPPLKPPSLINPPLKNNVFTIAPPQPLTIEKVAEVSVLSTMENVIIEKQGDVVIFKVDEIVEVIPQVVYEPPDLDGDGGIGHSEFQLLSQALELSAELPKFDFNNDKSVDLGDFTVLSYYWSH